MSSSARLSVHAVGKRFPGVVALDAVDFSVAAGEVVAVIGENGAGKSTLMKVLAGVQLPDSGEIRVEGERVTIDSVRRATALGIALIHQELNLCDNLSVAANISLGREPQRFGFFDEAEIIRIAAQHLRPLGLESYARSLAGDLSIGQRQLVEIARSLATDAKVLIMDEPTSSLSTAESERLFEVVAMLRERGVSVIYISHRLAEVMSLADRVVVLRDGENAGELTRAEISHTAMVRMMVGRDVSQFYHRSTHPLGEVLLKVSQLRTSAFSSETVTLEVCAGEIVGIAGLVGAGRTEVLQAIFGVDQAVSGDVEIAGQSLAMGDPSAAVRLGLALVPEDRKEHGIILDMNVRDNLGLTRLRTQRSVLVDTAAEAVLGNDSIAMLDIKTPGDQQDVRYLSGGNQQKVVLGKWLAVGPSVLLLDEPTRGIDIGAKEEIYQLMDRLAADGHAVLFVSSEMEEILGVADRVLVMHEGKLSGELKRDEFSEEAVMTLAVGGVLKR